MIYKAKKHLGQNFLKSQPALQMMCQAGEIKEDDIILEIGPGKGVLTSKLLERCSNVLAVEKDNDLIDILKEKFPKEIKSGKLKLLNEDILTFEPENHKLVSGKYKIIANIPYNITGAIFKKFLSSLIQPERMVLLVQKEVAERIVARDRKESILSLSVKAYGVPKYLMKVPKRFFSPEPKIDSAIISINNISKNNFKTKREEELFFRIIKLGFAHKRKVLRRNLQEDWAKEIVDESFRSLKIPENSRAEDISLNKWMEIASLLK